MPILAPEAGSAWPVRLLAIAGLHHWRMIDIVTAVRGTTIMKSNAGSYARIGSSVAIARETTSARRNQCQRLDPAQMAKTTSPALKNVIASIGARNSGEPALSQDMADHRRVTVVVPSRVLSLI